MIIFKKPIPNILATSIVAISMMSSQAVALNFDEDRVKYKYDPQGRLIEVEYVCKGATIKYTIDKADNRSQKEITGTLTGTCTNSTDGSDNPPPSGGPSAPTAQTIPSKPALPVNLPPVAVNDTGTVVDVFDTAQVYALNNDSDPEGDTMSITAVTSCGSGCTASFAIYNDLYVVELYSTVIGLKTTTYTVEDGKGNGSTADVSAYFAPVCLKFCD